MNGCASFSRFFREQYEPDFGMKGNRLNLFGDLAESSKTRAGKKESVAIQNNGDAGVKGLLFVGRTTS
jgi:hypothetical protein